MRYFYFVSYAHTTGFGRAQIEVDGIITSIEHIQMLEAKIHATNGCVGIMIMNFQLLRTEMPG